MLIFLTLTTAGADTGPFDLYTDADGYALPFDTGVPKSNLTTGYYISAPSGTTTVQVRSVGLCTNFIDIILTVPSTTTTTTTCPIYYELEGCDPADYAFTTIAPTLGTGQRYVLPLSPDPKFYTYTGASITSCVIPSPYNASIQATGLVNCPS